MFHKLIAAALPIVPKAIVYRVASRYITGETKETAIEMSQKLGAVGYATTMDILGEDITHIDQASIATNDYLELMDAVLAAGVEKNISLKLTALGLRMDQGRAFLELQRILDRAAEHDFFVRIDMEDSSLTDITLDFFRRARKIWPRTGTVLQSRLKRTVQDATTLAAEGANLRLCKGIYQEPPEIAYQKHSEINDSFVETAKVLLESTGYVGLATHDLPLVARLEQAIATKPNAAQNFEFQALLGVPMGKTLAALRDKGHTVRIYLPYGTDWYAYSVRRLKENPKMAGAVAKSLFNRDHLEIDQ